MLGDRASLNKFKKIEIKLLIFPEHSSMKLDVSYKQKTGKICGKSHKYVEIKGHATKQLMGQQRNQRRN